MRETLGDALPREMARVRDHVLPHYIAAGPAGAIGATFIRHDLDDAAKALASGDIAEMIRFYKVLKDTKS
jgi:hypothetical protein